MVVIVKKIKKECDNQISALQATLNRLPDMTDAVTQLLNRHYKQFLDLYDLYDHATLEDKRKLISLVLRDHTIFNGSGFEQKQVSNILIMIYKLLP